jgi:phosphomannomutase
VRTNPPREVGGVEVTHVIAGDGVKYAFGGDGWLLHRLSGTEPMVRLYCEHGDEATVEGVLDQVEKQLREFAAARRTGSTD